ncbi:hypothetical protein DPMN_184119 [Dreissena polymorpha]|uniref:Uncharacterized protein n=1 Tax=Dreissena polymorpha TaxID=45954 RepID=A0A9D4I718_DREPO|nr:hypothetical protein DPMN_184119 [Dreissena polymorpha]
MKQGPVFAGRSSRTSMDSPPFLTAALPAEKVEEVAGLPLKTRSCIITMTI